MQRIFRSFIYGLMITIGVLLIQGRVVHAAQISASDISIDYDTQRLIIKESTNTDLQIFFNVPKIKTVKKKNASGVTVKKGVLTASAWEIYDYDAATGVTIDLSNLNRTKDNYVQVKGDKTADPVTIKIPAILNSVSASFDVETTAVTLYDTTVKNNPVPVTGKTLEYRVANSGWKTYAGDDFHFYQVKGAKLTFRVAADTAASLETINPTILTDIVNADDQEVSAYVVGSFPGKEVKVTIKKRASAPKVTVDYARHQFKLPKNTEYRVIAGDKLNAWTKIKTAGSNYLKLTEIATLIGENVSASLEARTVATKTQPASKVSRIDFDMPAAAPEVHIRGSNDNTDIANLDIYDSWIGTDQDEPLLYTGYRYRQTTKAFQGVCIFTSTPEEYEVYISKDGQPPIASSAVTAIKRKKATSTSTHDVETLLSAAKVKNGDRIYIRRKADVKHKVFSSYFAGLGMVAYDPDKHAD